MKIELGNLRPPHFPTHWPGQWDVFHHFEYVCGIPSVICAITTVKENGKPNVCAHAWSSFGGEGGEKGGFYALLGGMSSRSHTYQNILRTGEFVLNFLPHAQYDALMKTIAGNQDEADEFAVAGFTPESAHTVACPRIQEAFLALECKLTQELNYTGGTTRLVIGQVQHVACAPGLAQGLDGKYGPEGFMFNIHAPMNPQTGEGNETAVATLEILRRGIG